MKNPFKSFAVFVLIIISMAFFGSCATHSHAAHKSQACAAYR